MRDRGRARGWALQGLYAWESRGGQPEDAVRVLSELFSTLRVSPTNRTYAEVLVRLVAGNLARVDRAIEESLVNWRMSRLSVVDRNVLRLGVAELLYVDDVPTRTTLREMTTLAAKFGTHESPRFVGGVLDGVAQKMGLHTAGPAAP